MTVAGELVDAAQGLERRLGRTSLEGGLTWFLQGTDDAPANATILTYTLDLVFQPPVAKHGKAVVALEAGERLGFDAVAKPLSAANYDAYYTNVTSVAPDTTDVVVPSVSQAYYEGEYLDGRLTVELGKLDVHSAYDTNAYANNEIDQFTSGMFVHPAGTSYPQLDRYYAPGVVLSYGLSKMIDITLVAANGNGAESHTERYYKLGVSDYLTLTADLQLLTYPGGNAAVDSVTAAGVRGQINF